MPALYVVVGFLVVQRLAELGFARRNHRALLARGAVEVGRRHYPAMVALHAGWLLALPATIDPRTAVSLPLLAVFVLLECGRVMGDRHVGVALDHAYRGAAGRRARSAAARTATCRHPNYVIVCGEMAVVPLMFGAWTLAVAASVLNLLVLRARLRVENRALETFGGDRDPAPEQGGASSIRPGA